MARDGLKQGAFSLSALGVKGGVVFPDGERKPVEKHWYTPILYYIRDLQLRMQLPKFVVNMKHPGQDAAALKHMLNLGFGEKDIDRLYQVFLRCDRDVIGVIELLDFDRYFKLGPYAIYSEKIFAMLDRDGDFGIAFDEFVIALYNYCSYDRDSLVKFAFTLIDANGSGKIERQELSDYMDTIYGRVTAAKSKRRVDEALRKFGKSELDHLGVNLPEFLAFSPKVPNLLFPAFHVQNILRHRTLGDMAWRRLSEGRLKDKERETNIYEILGRMRMRKVL